MAAFLASLREIVGGAVLEGRELQAATGNIHVTEPYSQEYILDSCLEPLHMVTIFNVEDENLLT